ncbi:MAG: hypothetical protein Q9175_005788 [Cornicularia normoerica]
MNSILAAALLFTTTFATPLNHNPKPDTTNVTIHSRQAPPGSGTDSGISISIFSSKDCKGKDEISQELLYSKEIAQQTLSYSLSDNLGSDQVLSFWADMNWSSTGSDPVDTGLNGNTNDACAQGRSHAGGVSYASEGGGVRDHYGFIKLAGVLVKELDMQVTASVG